MGNVNRLTTQLTSLLNDSGRKHRHIARAAGITHQTLYNLRDSKGNTSLTNFLAVANELGYDLLLVPLDVGEVANEINIPTAVECEAIQEKPQQRKTLDGSLLGNGAKS